MCNGDPDYENTKPKLSIAFYDVVHSAQNKTKKKKYKYGTEQKGIQLYKINRLLVLVLPNSPRQQAS